MLYTLLFLVLTYYILTHSEVSLYYAFHGFSLWYSKMIPSLLPFMIISGILIRMNLSEKFAGILHPFLKRLFRCSKNVSYGIIIGFLCGFPMGAKVTSDLLKNHKITQREAEFLLSFCNNIGPVYFCSFVIPLLGISQPIPYLIGMYCLPFLYGMVLRRTIFRDIPYKTVIGANTKTYKGTPIRKLSTVANHKNSLYQEDNPSLLVAIDDSIKSAIQSILMLCGYMILFNTINILPHYLTPDIHAYLAPILEITGGLSMLGTTLPLYSLCLLPFGGLSCIAQTNSMIKDTGLSIRKYMLHKMALTMITAFYYLLFSVF